MDLCAKRASVYILKYAWRTNPWPPFNNGFIFANVVGCSKACCNLDQLKLLLEPP